MFPDPSATLIINDLMRRLSGRADAATAALAKYTGASMVPPLTPPARTSAGQMMQGLSDPVSSVFIGPPRMAAPQGQAPVSGAPAPIQQIPPSVLRPLPENSAGRPSLLQGGRDEIAPAPTAGGSWDPNAPAANGAASPPVPVPQAPATPIQPMVPRPADLSRVPYATPPTSIAAMMDQITEASITEEDLNEHHRDPSYIYTQQPSGLITRQQKPPGAYWDHYQHQWVIVGGQQ